MAHDNPGIPPELLREPQDLEDDELANSRLCNSNKIARATPTLKIFDNLHLLFLPISK